MRARIALLACFLALPLWAEDPAPARPAKEARLLFTDWDAGRKVTVIQAASGDGSKIEKLGELPQGGASLGYQGFLGWSDNGQRMLVKRTLKSAGEEYPHEDLGVANADGSGLKWIVANRGGSIQWPSFSPDGEKVAFYSSRDIGRDEKRRWFGDHDLFVIGSDGAGDRRVVDCDSTDRKFDLGVRPAWSPDGQWIVFSRQWQDPDEIMARHYGIYAVGAGGGGLRQLKTPVYEKKPAWSPDGRRIAYYVGSCDAPGIWVADADGSNPHAVGVVPLSGLGLAGIDERPPAWSPDGGLIAFTRGGEIHVVAPDGSNLRMLTRVGDTIHTMAWSPDGKRVAFDAGDAVYVVDADGRNLKKVARGKNPVWERFSTPSIPRLSPPSAPPAPVVDPDVQQGEAAARLFKLYQKVRAMERQVEQVTLELGLGASAVKDIQSRIELFERASGDEGLTEDARQTAREQAAELNKRLALILKDQETLIRQTSEQYKELALQARLVLEKIQGEPVDPTGTGDLLQKIKAVTDTLESQSEILPLQLTLSAGRFPRFDEAARGLIARHEQVDTVYRLQAVSLLQRGDPRAALYALRKAQEANPDDLMTRGMLRDVEQGYLRAIAAKTLGDGAEVREKLEEALMDKGQAGWLNTVKDLLTTGVGTAAKEITGRGDIRSLADLAVRQADLAAVEHTGLQIILRLHKDNLTLDRIKGMSAEQLAQALQKLGPPVDAPTALRMQLAVSKAMNNDDVLRLVVQNKQQLDVDGGKSYYATGAFERTWIDHAGDAINVANVATLLPGAVIGKGTTFGLAKGVEGMTVGSALFSGARLGKVAAAMEKSAAGRAILQELTRFHETTGVVSKTLAQALVDQGVLEAGAYVGGRPGEIAAQVLTTLGATNLDEAVGVLRRRGLPAKAAEQLSARSSARQAAVAEARAPSERVLSDLVPRIKGGKLAAEEAPDLLGGALHTPAEELQIAGQGVERTIEKTQKVLSKSTTNTVLIGTLHEQTVLQDVLQSARRGERGRTQAGMDYLKELEEEVAAGVKELEETVQVTQKIADRTKKEALPPTMTVKIPQGEALSGGRPELSIKVVGGKPPAVTRPSPPRPGPPSGEGERAAEEAIRAKRWNDAEARYAVLDAQLGKQGLHGDNPRLAKARGRERLMRKLQSLAEEQAAYAASQDAVHLAQKAVNRKALEPFGEGEAEALLKGKRLEDLESLRPSSGEPTYMKPVKIRDEAGVEVAVFKPRHPAFGGYDLRNEQAAAAVYNAMGIPTPAVTRATLLTKEGEKIREIEGVLTRYVHGQDLMKADEAQLFQTRELIAADKVVRARLGDGDGHAGNLMATLDGRGYSIDHGLADIPGTWRKQEGIELGKDMQRKLEVLPGRDPTMERAEGYIARGDLEAAQGKADKVLTDDNLRKLWAPIYKGHEKEMEEAIQATLARGRLARPLLESHFPPESLN